MSSLFHVQGHAHNYAWILKKSVKGEVGVKYSQFKTTRKKRFCFLLFSKEKMQKNFTWLVTIERFISCLGNLFQDYHINQNFMDKEKNKQWKACYFGAEKKEIYMICFSILRTDLWSYKRVWELYCSHFPSSAYLG